MATAAINSQPLNCYQTPIRLNHPLGNGVNKTYIACTRPAYKPAFEIQKWVRCQNEWLYVEFACGHDAMVICPDALAQILIGGAS